MVFLQPPMETFQFKASYPLLQTNCHIVSNMIFQVTRDED